MSFLDVLLPRRCGICRRVGDAVCGGCLQRLVRCVPPLCERCGAPGPWPVRRCAECSGRRLAFRTARAALVYDDHARRLVASWKERGRRDLSHVAAHLVCEAVPRPDVDAITFVPGDRDRGLIRGHVPAAELATHLAELWALPLARFLARRPGIERQRNLPRVERGSNVAKAFTSGATTARRICLVDDVYTTGSTVAACSSALRREGAKHVAVVCLARAVR